MKLEWSGSLFTAHLPQLHYAYVMHLPNQLEFITPLAFTVIHICSGVVHSTQVGRLFPVCVLHVQLLGLSVARRWHEVVVKANPLKWTKAVSALAPAKFVLAQEGVSGTTAPQMTQFLASKLPSPWR